MGVPLQRNDGAVHAGLVGAVPLQRGVPRVPVRGVLQQRSLHVEIRCWGFGVVRR